MKQKARKLSTRDVRNKSPDVALRPNPLSIG